MAKKRDYYDVLGLSKGASASEIKKAYRKAALKYHPDRVRESGLDPKVAEERFKEVNEAYSILSDSDKKRQYDQFGHAAFSQYGGTGSFEGFDPMEIFKQFFGGSFGSPFGSSFGGSSFSNQRSPFSDSSFQSGRRPQKGSDVKISLTIKQSELLGTSDLKKTISMKSKMQDGQTKRDKIRIPIPKNVKDGQILRITKKGRDGKFGGPPGDLLVTIALEDDLLVIPVSIFLAIRGSDDFTVKTPSGEHLKGIIPVNTPDNHILDFINQTTGKIEKIRIKHRYPRELTDKHKELLSQLYKLEN